MRLSNIILRLEGVFALTGDAYFKAMNEALDEAGFGHRIAHGAFLETFGHDVGRKQFLAYATRHLYPRKQTSDLHTLFEVTYKRLRLGAHDILSSAKSPLGPGIGELVHAAHAAGIGVILVTGLPLPLAEKFVLASGGEELRGLLGTIIKQDAADPSAAFVEAAARAAGPAIVLESSTPGLAAAEAAGLPAVAIIGQSVLADGIHCARAVVDKLPDLVDETASDVDGNSLLAALDAIVAGDAVAKKIIDLQVRDVLRDKGAAVKSVNPTDTIEFLTHRLQTENVGAMVVIADTGVLEGIVSERDLARGIAQYGPSVLAMPVSAIMTRAVITCAPVDSIHNVAKVMTARRIRHLPVSDGQNLVGLVSIGDVLSRRLEEVRYEANVLRRTAETDVETE